MPDTIDPSADSTEQARCKCGHEIRDHWLLRVSYDRTVEGGCIHQACGCKAWRPAETAR